MPRVGLLEPAQLSLPEILEERYQRAMHIVNRINDPPYASGGELRVLNKSLNWYVDQLEKDFRAAIGAEPEPSDPEGAMFGQPRPEPVAHLSTDYIIKRTRNGDEPIMRPTHLDLAFLGVKCEAFQFGDPSDENVLHDIFAYGWDIKDRKDKRITPPETYVAIGNLAIVEEEAHWLN